MCDTLTRTVEAAEKIAGSLDPDLLHPRDAVRALEQAARLKKIGSAIETLLAARVAASGNWQSEGDKSPAEFISRKTGETIRGAVDLITTAKALQELSKTDRAFRSGRLTQEQASEVASAAIVVRRSEDRLIALAETEGLAGVRQEAQRVKAAACRDQKEKSQRLHRERYLRTWMQSDGAFRLAAQLTPEAGAEVQAVIDGVRTRLANSGSADSQEALGADALLEMARGAASGNAGRVRAEVFIRVDLEALRRGYLEQGEVCEATGVGPISVEGAAEFLDKALVRLIGVEGSNITRVDHAGRYVPKTLRTAVRQRDTKCVIAGCAENKNLELDHTLALGDEGRTNIKNLKSFCKKHHRMKHGNYALVRQSDDPEAYRLIEVKPPTLWDAYKSDRNPP